MRLEELNWMDVENYLKSDNRLIFIFGSCEQHAYLSLLTDVKIPSALADAASAVSGVLVAPPLNFGASPYFMAYPGTLSLRITTLLDIAEDLVLSAYQHGFRRLLILNGHGGNEPIRLRLYELASRYKDLQIAWYAWWQSNQVQEVAMKYGIKPAHANWLEAFPFTRVAELPDIDKLPAYIPGLLGADQARDAYGDGSFGGPYQVNQEILDEIFQAALEAILGLLRFE